MGWVTCEGSTHLAGCVTAGGGGEDLRMGLNLTVLHWGRLRAQGALNSTLNAAPLHPNPNPTHIRLFQPLLTRFVGLKHWSFPRIGHLLKLPVHIPSQQRRHIRFQRNTDPLVTANTQPRATRTQNIGTVVKEAAHMAGTAAPALSDWYPPGHP